MLGFMYACVYMMGEWWIVYVCVRWRVIDGTSRECQKKSEQTLRWHGQHHRCPQENESLVPRMEEYISEWSGEKNYGEIVDAVDGFANITVRSRC